MATVALAAGTALAVAACGGSSTGAPTAAPTAGPPTAAPTGAATAAPTAQPSPTPIALAKTFTAANGRAIGHPEGWVVRDNLGIVYAVTTEAASDRLVTFGSLEAGQAFVQFGQYSILYGATADPFVHLPDNLRLLLEGSGFTAGEPAGLPWAARPAARIDAANDKIQMLAVSIKVRDDLFADVIAYTKSGEMAAHEALILAMIESLAYPPVLTGAGADGATDVAPRGPSCDVGEPANQPAAKSEAYPLIAGWPPRCA